MKAEYYKFGDDSGYIKIIGEKVFLMHIKDNFWIQLHATSPDMITAADLKELTKKEKFLVAL